MEINIDNCSFQNNRKTREAQNNRKTREAKNTARSNTNCGFVCTGVLVDILEKNVSDRDMDSHIDAYAKCTLYRVPEHISCHGMYRPMHAFCAIKLPCSGTR
jgi:hypothetical protein